MTTATVKGIFCFTLLLITACATLDPGGSGTETTTGVVGAVVNDQGLPQADVRVHLFPEAHNPVRDAITIPAETTDSQGRFAFRNIRSGRYTMLAVHRADGTRTLISGIIAARDTVQLPVRTLLTPGSVKVSLHPGINVATGYVYIPGTTVYSFIHSPTGFVVLDSVPAGSIPEIAYSSTDSAAATAIRYNVPVNAGDTTEVRNPLWKYACTVILNTSATGASVAKTVVGFPVLIRLNAGNFDFSQARPNGADIRFTKSDTATLPHEIERWNPAGNAAEIWVKVDTILGNSASQSIIMYWGNDVAGSSSSGSAVFDTAAGFQGVWHFSDRVSDPVHDATVNGYHGMSPDTARPQIAEGRIGNCRVFDGVADYITMPNTAGSKLNFPEEGYYTVSAWVALDSLDGAPHLILAKGFTQYFLRFTYFPSNSPVWEFVEFSETKRWQACTNAATGRQWTLLTGVRQGSRQMLYCNGAFVDSTPNSYPNNNFYRDMSNDLSIGKFLTAVDVQGVVNESYCLFKGAIDEVRISSAAQNADWVRLCYMNQGSVDNLVQFK